MGNFYIVEAGGNGFAARKQKKIHPKGQKQIKHFCGGSVIPAAVKTPDNKFARIIKLGVAFWRAPEHVR